MLRRRAAGAPFLPGKDHGFPCPRCGAGTVDAQAFPAVEIMEPYDQPFDAVFVRDWMDGESTRMVYVCDTCSHSWDTTGRTAISYAEIKYLWLTDRAGYDAAVIEASCGQY